jgi:thiamine-phosphate diphosphorylase
MTAREKLDISAYFVVGPENTKGRDTAKIISDAVAGGFTCVQIRSKTASARELIQLTKEASDAIDGKPVTLLVNDRLDVILAARKMGALVDGIHVGQSDIPVDICRQFLGADSVIGLSAATDELHEYLKTADISQIDYFGIGPLRETATKPDCGLGADGKVITRSFDEIAKLAQTSALPLVVGGGVQLSDLPQLAKTSVAGFFVVTAISEAADPKAAAAQMVNAWTASK